uniref:Methyltransferase like 26 n=1 Tax=Terrapene triunguis TaxID=2587831 RepID=A0A674J4S8_9SAUR
MLVSPVAERNKELILEVLADYVDDTSQAFGLELASGTGQHVVHFAQALPNVTWQPSEISPDNRSLSVFSRGLCSLCLWKLRKPCQVLLGCSGLG